MKLTIDLVRTDGRRESYHDGKRVTLGEALIQFSRHDGSYVGIPAEQVESCRVEYVREAK